jgi:hypothetical protein
MALIVTATPTKVDRGYYFYQVSIGTGSTAVTISINGLPGIALTDLAKTASGVGYIALPECTLTATLTGDAKFALEPVATDIK